MKYVFSETVQLQFQRFPRIACRQYRDNWRSAIVVNRINWCFAYGNDKEPKRLAVV